MQKQEAELDNYKFEVDRKSINSVIHSRFDKDNLILRLDNVSELSP